MNAERKEQSGFKIVQAHVSPPGYVAGEARPHDRQEENASTLTRHHQILVPCPSQPTTTGSMTPSLVVLIALMVVGLLLCTRLRESTILSAEAAVD